MSVTPPEPAAQGAARPDLDIGLPLVPAAAPEQESTRNMFAAQHPFLFLSSMAMVFAVGVVALATLGGIAAHALYHLVLWGWALLP